MFDFIEKHMILIMVISVLLIVGVPLILLFMFSYNPTELVENTTFLMAGAVISFVLTCR